MEALTPAERRGALLVALLLTLGAGHDLWRASRPLPTRGPGEIVPGVRPGVVESGPAGPDHGLAAERRSDPTGLRIAAPPPVTDLNRATARELDALPGVGPVLAARIIARRERLGPFHRREELMTVRGIGPRLYARLEPHVTVGDAGAPAAPPRAPSAPVPGRGRER